MEQHVACFCSVICLLSWSTFESAISILSMQLRRLQKASEVRKSAEYSTPHCTDLPESTRRAVKLLSLSHLSHVQGRVACGGTRVRATTKTLSRPCNAAAARNTRGAGGGPPTSGRHPRLLHMACTPIPRIEIAKIRPPLGATCISKPYKTNNAHCPKATTAPGPLQPQPKGKTQEEPSQRSTAARISTG